jgi:tRNA threonylcarbamoyladenosine biosynthesis protein TsaE
MGHSSDQRAVARSWTLETSSAQETEGLAAELAPMLKAGDVVLLKGELGTGKTTFVRGVVHALGITDAVNSPTFSIGHRYVGEHTTVSHLDLYRLGMLEEEDPGLLSDYLTGEEIALIEWPDTAHGVLGEPRLEINISHRGQDKRLIEVSQR